MASIAAGEGPKGFSLAFNRTVSPGRADAALASAADSVRRASSRAAPATAVPSAPAKRRRVMGVVIKASSTRFAGLSAAAVALQTRSPEILKASGEPGSRFFAVVVFQRDGSL